MSEPTEYEKLVKKSKKRELEDNLFEEFRFYGLPLPTRQHPFHPVRKWRADFAWIDLKIIVEIQGGIYMPKGAGGHNRGAYMEETYDKENEAVLLGWRVFKFGPSQVRRKKRTNESSQALAFMYKILGGK